MDSIAFWKFIDDNKSQSPSALRLKYHGKKLDFDIDFAILQIECRQRFGKKLSATLQDIDHFIFPTLLAGEQATSDLLADFHASLVDDMSKVVDLTCGLGIDAMHMARKAAKLVAIDNEPCKIDALRHNVECAAIENLECKCLNCEDFLSANTERFDVAFIDPARRREDGSRAYGLQDCIPDLTILQHPISKMASKMIAKCSPMLDITLTANQLDHISHVYAVGTNTECKELVAVCDYIATDDKEYAITAATIDKDGIAKFSFSPSQERECGEACIGIPHPGQYLYVPSPAVMKAAPFKLLANMYGLVKLHPNTHLYYSDNISDSFPGQQLKIVDVITYESKNIKRLRRSYPVISVATRNFDVSADDLRKKLGVKDGGNHRLFAVTAANGAKLMIICEA